MRAAHAVPVLMAGFQAPEKITGGSASTMKAGNRTSNEPAVQEQESGHSDAKVLRDLLQVVSNFRLRIVLAVVFLILA